MRTVYSDGIAYRVVTVPAGADQALVLAQSLEPQTRVLRQLGIAMLVAGGLGVLAAGLAGWAVARNGLRPVRRLTADVEEIARTEDLTPLVVEGDDEVARLATAFNSMLTALAASRDRQRRLVADAGSRAADAADLAADQPRPARPGRRDRRRAAPRRPRGAARGRPRPDRGAHHPDRRPRRAGPRRAVDPRGRVRRPRRRARPRRHPGPAPGARHPARGHRGAVVGHRRDPVPGARGHQPARQRGQVEPARRRRPVPRWPTAR